MHHMLATYDPQYITDHILAILDMGSNMQQLMTRNMQERPQYYATRTQHTPFYTLTQQYKHIT